MEGLYQRGKKEEMCFFWDRAEMKKAQKVYNW